eukprot:jgi/Ulvmu1/987/UM103_0014.1
MNGTVKEETSCGPTQDAIDNTVFSGSDHTRNDVDGGQIYHSGLKNEADWDDEHTRNLARKRSSRICKMEEKKKEEEEKRAEEEAEAERKAEEKRIARQRRKQVKEMHQSTEDQQRRMYGVYPAAHRDGVQYMVPAGMVAGIPHGHHMIPVGPHGPGMPPPMMQPIMMQPQPQQPPPQQHAAAAPAAAAATATATGSPAQPAAARWALPPPAAAAPAPSATPPPPAAEARPSSAQKEHAETNRNHSGWTPVATRKLSARCLKQRIPRKKAQRARIRALKAVTATWDLQSAAGPAAPAVSGAGAGSSASGQPQPNSAAAKARATMVREDLMRRRADTQQQLRKLVQSGKISAETAQQRMTEVDQLSSVVVQVCPSHPTATLHQLVSIAQSIINARNQQRQVAIQQHPMFARLTGQQQRQLLELPYQQGTQVLANLTAQHNNAIQAGPQSHMSQQTHMTHFQPRSAPAQMQMRPQAAPHPFSQAPMMAAPHNVQMQMHAQQMQHPAMQAQHVQHAQRVQQGQPAMRGGMTVSQAQAQHPQHPQRTQHTYSVQNINPLDDPLMSTMM